jgi:CRISPR-associated exonuclease Cas4
MAARSKMSISSIITAAICPLRIYYGSGETDRHEFESPRYTVCKQISMHLGSPLDSARIWEEICTVDPHIDPIYQAFLDECISYCSISAWRSASCIDVPVSSDRYRIFGSVDRLFDEPPYFSVVRSSKAPTAGVYHHDRLRVACYALCLQELLGIPVAGGSVDYIPSGVQRYYEIQPRDTRAFLSGRTVLESVMEGRVPKKPVNAPCRKCPFEALCTPGGRRLSDILDKK